MTTPPLLGFDMLAIAGGLVYHFLKTERAGSTRFANREEWMQHFDCAAGIAAALVCAAALSGCQAPSSQSTASVPAGARQYAALVAPYAPPPKRAEIPPPAASAGALWRFGHWQWSSGRFVWQPGRYIVRPSPTANWIPGYWQQAADGWVWTDGRWAS